MKADHADRTGVVNDIAFLTYWSYNIFFSHNDSQRGPMSDITLDYFFSFISGLLLPSVVFIIASWRVARLRNLTMDNYQARVNDSVAETIKEQLSCKVLDPLLSNNNVVLPPGQGSYDLIDTLVPGNEVDLLAAIYIDLVNLGT